MHRFEHRHERTALICVEPGATILSLEDAKAHLRVESDDDDTLIEELCAVATSLLDGSEGDTKRALCTQTWKLVLPSFVPRDPRFDVWPRLWSSGDRYNRIDLPLPPAIGVDSVNYVDTNGDPQTLDPSLYRFIQCGTEASFLLPAYSLSWPSTRWQPDAVTIQFDCGYSDVGDVPPNAIAAAKLIVGHLYQNREAVTDGRLNQPFVMPMGVDSLLWNVRIRNFK